MDFGTNINGKSPFSLLTSVSLLSVFFLLPGPAAGQTRVTFRLDVSQEIARHFFRPDSDSVELFGNIQPLSMKQSLQMEPVDKAKTSYTVTVQFPAANGGQVLTFRYALRLNGVLQPEQNSPPRQIMINSGNVLLPVTHPRLKFELLESRLMNPTDNNRWVPANSERPLSDRDGRIARPALPPDPSPRVVALQHPITQNTELNR